MNSLQQAPRRDGRLASQAATLYEILFWLLIGVLTVLLLWAPAWSAQHTASPDERGFAVPVPSQYSSWVASLPGRG